VVVISLVWLVACLGGGSGLCVLVRAGTARLGQAKAITTVTASATVFTAIPTVSSIPYILTSKRDSAAVIIVDTTTDDATTPTRGCGRAHRLAAATAITTVLALLSRPAASATVAMDVSVLSTAASTQHATP